MHQVKVGVAICSPIPVVQVGGRLIKERVSIEWHRARSGLATPTNTQRYEFVADGMEVGEARNHAIKMALAHRPQPEFLFFLDYDVIPSYDAMTKLLFRARHFPDYAIIAGVYCSKTPIPEPLLYMREGDGPYWDWAVGDLVFDLAATHMGLTLLRLSMFDDWPYDDEAPWFYSANRYEEKDGHIVQHRGTEDIHFCAMARERGFKIMADTSVLAKHEDINTGIQYGSPPDCMPVKRARWLPINDQDEPPPEKIALDIGCGESRREWEGYSVERLDIRSDVGADYVQDTRYLNLPANHFDLVASSHHLEHLGRWDQETVWAEMFKIMKPGGTCEHIVPNIQWAARHLFDGRPSEHVYNVLYGAQEQHGYNREYNTHYFGYEPYTARALAEGCGLVDVEIKTWEDDPALGYNLIITGRKPEVAEVEQPDAEENGKEIQPYKPSRGADIHGAAARRGQLPAAV